jgi:hypothetical protein
LSSKAIRLETSLRLKFSNVKALARMSLICLGSEFFLFIISSKIKKPYPWSNRDTVLTAFPPLVLPSSGSRGLPDISGTLRLLLPQDSLSITLNNR